MFKNILKNESHLYLAKNNFKDQFGVMSLDEIIKKSGAGEGT